MKVKAHTTQTASFRTDRVSDLGVSPARFDSAVPSVSIQFMKVKVTAKKPEHLTGFKSISGTFSCDATSEEANDNSACIFNAIEVYFSDFTVHPLKIELFQSNGHAIIGDVPTAGHFLVTQNSTRMHCL